MSHPATLRHGRPGFTARAVAFVATALLAASAAYADLKITTPRCEYAADPLGIDIARPRLSWILESTERNARQTGYRIRVGSTRAGLEAGKADIWDSGEVRSDQSVHVEYAGPALKPRQQLFWQVQVWDNHGGTATSDITRWEMGLLDQAAGAARWIQFTEQADDPSLQFEGASWIWSREQDQQNPPANTDRFFVREVDLSGWPASFTAKTRITADDQFELFVNGQPAGKSSGQEDAWKTIQVFDISRHLKSGVNLIAVKCSQGHSAAGLIASIAIESGDKRTRVVTDPSWTVASNAGEGWPGQAGGDGWSPAVAVAPMGGGPWKFTGGELGKCPHFRKQFEVQKPVASARLYASALGVYEATINGRRVGRDYFNPGWTDFAQRVQYHTYDVTDLLKSGDNAIGIILGDGWYAGHVGLGGPHRYGATARAWARLDITYEDGTTSAVGTDQTWRASNGPLLQSDMLMGETYDARREMPGWNQPGFSDASWKPAQLFAGPFPAMTAAVDEPVRVMAELESRTVAEPKPGVFVFDLGQNMVGWARLKVKGKAGDTVTLRFAEMLNPDGTIYTTNLRGAKCTDVYTLAGRAGGETYEPRFTFHGFRYVELTGYPGKPGTDAVTGIVAYSDTPPSGAFECSDSRINQLQSNIIWGQRGNFLSVPTDCPQRDERLGWTGDAQIFIRTATFNMDVSRFFTKWCRDLEEAQRPDGAFTDVAPFVAAGAGTAAWGDAGVICPWTVYRVYGDTRILHERYQSAKKWISYLETNSKDLLRPAQGYGDWIAIGADTPKDVLATAYFAHATSIVASWASVIGQHADAEKYRDLFERIKVAFNRAYVSADGRIKGDTQTCYVLALSFELLPEELRPLAAEHLAADIKAKGNHLSTGFVGVGHLTPTLTRVGKPDLAYALLIQETFPGWLYSVKNGATTIWERWDGWTKEKGFQDPGMNSFNHYSLGSVGEWMYSTVLGIDLDPHTPGFKKAIIHPRPGGGLTWAKGHYDSVYGRYESSWEQDGSGFALDVTIPANATATIILPAGSATEGGKPLDQVSGLKAESRGSMTAVTVGSGTYSFVVKP
ncbi:MAG: hypothetical protein GIKADHBN_01968 [Phycisphaerales bacterium]|nr:hypothetical protein [Phycisphaerales bacterium]